LPANPGDKKVTLSWTISNAETATLSGVGSVDAKSKIVLQLIDAPAQDTTYTLTATGPGGTVSRAVIVHSVPAPQGQYTLKLSPSVAGANAVTSDSATVEGTVSPAPPAGTTLRVSIGVGATGVVVPVGGDGTFVAVVPLKNKVTRDDLILLTTGLTVTQCGTGVSTVILLENAKSQADRANDIDAVVLASDDKVVSNLATLTVYHTVVVNSVSVDWSGPCAGPHEEFPGGLLEPSGQFLNVGHIDCGFGCPGPVGDCPATSTVTVSTSVGPLTGSGDWHTNIR
jgi:hypothetical protein